MNCIHSIVKILPEAILPHTFQFTDRLSNSGFIGNWSPSLSHCVESKRPYQHMWNNVFWKETLRIICGVYKKKKNQRQGSPYLILANQVYSQEL